MAATTYTVRGFLRYGWATLGVTLLVIVWGAVVRATGSGAGCGSHWPLCNGDVVPLAPTVATMIEFVHRVTSGVVMIMAVWLVVAARRAFPAGHQVRRWAVISLIFMLIEAAIGAGIVLLELVGDNASAARAAYVGGHLVNTLLLVGAITTTLWWAHRSEAAGGRSVSSGGGLTYVLLGMLVVASTGAIVALGDTLFPHASLAEGIAADFDPAAHFLIRLRIWHPIAAVIVAGAVLWLAWMSPVLQTPSQRTARRLIVWAVFAQSALGVINLLLLAPLALQMAHLLVSNLLWIPLVWAWRTAQAPAPDFSPLHRPVHEFCFQRLASASRRPLVIGLQAPQGAGKTTLVTHLLDALPARGWRGAGVSIDDFYLTRDEQLQLAAAHPANPYLEHRGYPGTHDVPLGVRTVTALKQIAPGQTVRVPVYDKSAHGGRGDRAPEAAWRAVEGPLDLIVVEGWMLGFTPVADELLPDTRMTPANHALADYDAWYALVDEWVVLRAAQAEQVVDWRIEAEEKMKAAGKPGLSREAIEDYVRRFLPAYHTWANGRAAGRTPALTITLGPDRRPAV